MGCSLSPATSALELQNLPIDVRYIPTRYNVEPLTILGKGGCGVVLKCKDNKTNQDVAIKLSTSYVTLKNEIAMLRLLNKTTSDDSFVKILSAPWSCKYMVMELLDMNFRDYVVQNAPLKLQEIRIVIKQLAVALKSLRANHIIHADFKLNNIMLEDHIRKPLKVKIIDFGLAISDDDAAAGFVRQAYLYRAPEIILKLPFSGAVDIWSLGCIMASMILGLSVFPGQAVYDQLYYMTKLLGPAPQHILSESTETYKYFQLTARGWVLKLPTYEEEKELLNNRQYTFTKLDEVKNMRREPENHAEAEEREQCTELLKAMLKWDEKERITPRDILKHSFITESFRKGSRRKEARSKVDPRCTPSTSDSVYTVHSLSKEDTEQSVQNPHCWEFVSRRRDQHGQTGLSHELWQSADDCLPKSD